MNNINHKGWVIQAPVSFIEATPEERAEVCNGMGPKGYGWVIPDTMYGLNLEAAGDVHDWMYYHATYDRNQCDDVFLKNMKSIIEQHDGWSILQWLRNRRALKYYWAVRKFGLSSYGKRCECARGSGGEG